MRVKFLVLMFALCMSIILVGCGSSSSYSSSSSNYDNDYSYGDGYGYNSTDPYYSNNDHNNDGKINESEFQDSVNDYLDDIMGY